jgi:hypothetical protein
VTRANSRRIDELTAFVICSKKLVGRREATQEMTGKRTMTGISARTFLIAAALSALSTSMLSASAFAQAATPWELKPDMGYGYDKEGKTFSYTMGTNNAGALLKGAKKVPKGTLFFIGQNGQLYMRTGPYLEGDGKFMFGPN